MVKPSIQFIMALMVKLVLSNTMFLLPLDTKKQLITY